MWEFEKQVVGEHKKPKSDSFCCQILSTRLQTFRIHHSTFASFHHFLTCQKKHDSYSTIMSAIAPKIIINAAKSMVNPPQTRNDTFNRQLKSEFDASPEVCCVL
jgi:hypothetical protein